jgi:hypothetical protein
VPDEVLPYVSIYEKYYSKKYPERNIRWNHEQGCAVVKTTLNNRVYYFKVTTLQMFVLSQFNVHKCWSALELKENLGTTLQQTGKILNSLLRARILVRDVAAPNDPNVTFTVNNKFFHKNQKLSLVQFLNPNGLTPLRKIDKELAIDRTTLTKAVIVRQLKHKKQMDLTELFKESDRLLSFDLDISMFDDALAKLFEKEYCKKMDGDVIKYVEELTPDDDKD